jgi:hypothetical protein
MGQGRVTVAARGNLYLQTREFAGAPRKDAQVATGTLGIGFGVNPYIDLFAAANAYNVGNSPGSEGGGLGTILGGVQGSIPFSQTIPGRVGFQLSVLAGTAGSQINENRADGYNYFETRQNADFSFKLTQSIVWKSLLEFRLHFNEGIVTSLQTGKDALLLQAAGVEFAPAPSFTLGAEFHSRTTFKTYEDGDPFWFAPSLGFRSGPNHLNLQLGAEISLSESRPGPGRPLEPWRLFGAIAWSYNPNPGREREAAKAREDSVYRARRPWPTASDARPARIPWPWPIAAPPPAAGGIPSPCGRSRIRSPCSKRNAAWRTNAAIVPIGKRNSCAPACSISKPCISRPAAPRSPSTPSRT